VQKLLKGKKPRAQALFPKERDVDREASYVTVPQY